MQTPAYLEVPSGQVWKVEVVHSEGQICLAEGWQDFSNYYSISCGHLLMFGYNGRSHFNVTIFDLSASEIEYPHSAVNGTRHAQERDQIESDDSIEILEDIPKGHKGKAKIYDVIDISAENKVHIPLGKSSKRKIQEEDSEDDVSTDMLTKRMDAEKSKEDVASPSSAEKGQKDSEGCRKHKQKSKIVHNANKRVMDEERAIAYQRAKAFITKNPFIITFMWPSYVYSPFNLSISLKFARKYFLEDSGDLVLRVRGRDSWSVKCTLGTMNAKIHSGWKAFVLDNKLKVGDVCVFEVIKGAKMIDVTIFRAAGSKPMHKIGVQEVPGVFDSKNKNIETDNSVPCSQPKIVHAKKLKQLTGGSYDFNSKIKEEHCESAEDTGIARTVKILGHCPLGPGGKRKRQEEDEAEDDVSIDVHTKIINVEKSQEDEASPSFTTKTKKSGESRRMHKQQSKIIYVKNKTVADKERTITYQRAKAFKSKNPFILSFMQPSYVSTPYTLSLRLTFANKYFGENGCNLMLRVPGGGSWSVKYCLGTSDAKFLSGWKAFVLDNKLKFGDVCVFEVIKGAQLFIDVTIFRAAGSTPMHKIEGDVPGVSASKNKIIKTESSVPYSHPEIVHSRKLNHEKQQKGDKNCFTSKVKEELDEGTTKYVQQSNTSCMGRVMAKQNGSSPSKSKSFYI